jgi:hypothetical protein
MVLLIGESGRRGDIENFEIGMSILVNFKYRIVGDLSQIGEKLGHRDF